MRIFVVLPVHNRRVMTIGFLESLVEQSIDAELSVFIVDDGSTDDTVYEVESWAAHPGRDIRVTILRGDGNLWWAGAVQKALSRILGQLADNDWVYLGNNDTILDSHHLRFLAETATKFPLSLVGARSFEVWADGHRHPVSAGFQIDAVTLEATAIPGSAEGIMAVSALSGRGILIPARAARDIRMHPGLMPQHFADIAFTGDLRRRGYRLLVDHRAVSEQTARAGSSVEFRPRVGDVLHPRSSLYLPALVTYWWRESDWRLRCTLPFRLVWRGFRRARAGSYAFSSTPRAS